MKADDKDALKKVQELASGRGACYAFVTVGNTAGVQHGFFNVRSVGYDRYGRITTKGRNCILTAISSG